MSVSFLHCPAVPQKGGDNLLYLNVPLLQNELLLLKMIKEKKMVSFSLAVAIMGKPTNVFTMSFINKYYCIPLEDLFIEKLQVQAQDSVFKKSS